jgi:hypothetical protein
VITLTPARFAMLLATLVGVLSLASIPVIVSQDLRSTMASTPLGGDANGTVVAVESKGDGYVATVEFPARPETLVRARIPIDAIGSGPWRRAEVDVGDPVIVLFNPANPSEARLGGIRQLWSAIVKRAAVGAIGLITAVAIHVATQSRRRQ